MLDLMGVEVEVGDTIVAGVTLGQTASTRVGTVMEIIETIDKGDKVRVSWTHGPAIPAKPTLLNATRGYSDLASFVILEKVNKNAPPQKGQYDARYYDW